MRRFLLLFAAITVAAIAQGRDDLPLSGEQLLLAQVDLELRQAGGVDADAVARLLEQGFRPTGDWFVRAARACSEGAVPCSSFLPLATERLATSDGFLAPELKALRLIEMLAPLEGQDGWDRQQAFKHALLVYLATAAESGGTARRTANAQALRCAERALEEGFLELAPFIRDRGLAAYPSIAEAERFAAALWEADPIASLLRLVDQAVDADTKFARQRSSRFPRIGGLMAVAELRRRYPTAVLVELRDALARYDCGHRGLGVEGTAQDDVGNWFEIDFGQLSAEEHTQNVSQRGRCMGELGAALAELIGDLGDRMTEQRALGVPTLADRVEEGLRREAELLARDEHENNEGCEAGLALPVEIVRTLDTMMALQRALVYYAVDHNVFPEVTRSDELAPLIEIYAAAAGSRQPWLDGWGFPLEVTAGGVNHRIRSTGRDGLAEPWEPAGAVEGSERDIVLGESSFLQWPRGLPQQTVELRQRFTQCVFRRIQPGMGEEQVLALLEATPLRVEEGENVVSLRWSNYDGSAITVRLRSGQVVTAEWRERQRPR